MTRPDADEPHDIADTQMFRRFVNEDQNAKTGPKRFWMWTWPGLLLPAVVSIAIVVVVIVLVTK